MRTREELERVERVAIELYVRSEPLMVDESFDEQREKAADCIAAAIAFASEWHASFEHDEKVEP